MTLGEYCKENGITVRELSARTFRPERTLYRWWINGNGDKVKRLVSLVKIKK